MFLFFNKKEVRPYTVKIRDEWGTLHEEKRVTKPARVSRRGVPFLTDQELAEALGTSLVTVQRETEI